ncbi:hypothetical protein B1748_08475 [Paenibacillus sp. MY03]|jgi:hypothetical protein|uniref:cold-shock protein n=1 Tax=Paenibacillus TaxID=44249 RepID=UPI000B3C59F4|nr:MULTISPECIES: cold-shock protein [Paenibacillus]OUS77175.1 hypothetical protein B1748_08475 [Paenibacillus sp. MY03]QNK57346.1 cold-shock protein [Paenibacillus sp. PAMC21692]
MAYSWNKPLDNLPEELTTIWSCGRDDCNGWIRDSFSFKEQPTCPMCKSAMIRSEKLLPILVTTDQEIKHYRKKQRAEGIS